MRGWAIALAPTVAAALAGALTASGAQARMVPLNDAASLPGRAQAQLAWSGPPGRDAATAEARVEVRIILASAAFAGRRAKVWMMLPPQPVGPVAVDWTSRGALLPGALSDGGRALVYAGVIPARPLADTLSLRVKVDGRRVRRPTDLAFHFEIETP